MTNFYDQDNILKDTSCAYTGTGNNPFIGNPNCKSCDGSGYIKGYDNKLCPECEKKFKENFCSKCKDTEQVKGCSDCGCHNFNQNCNSCKGTGMGVNGEKCFCSDQGNKNFVYSGKGFNSCNNTGFITGDKCKDCYSTYEKRDPNCKKCRGTGMKEKGKACKRCLIKK